MEEAEEGEESDPGEEEPSDSHIISSDEDKLDEDSVNNENYSAPVKSK